MYSEKTFKNYIFWIQVKRVVLIILLCCIGAAIGVLISEILESLIKSKQYNVIIIVASTVIMFFLSLLLTTGTGKEVQDGYWKIAVLRKLTTIQKLIETNNALMGNDENALKSSEINKLMVIGDKTNKEIQAENSNDLEYEEDVEEEIEVSSGKTNKTKREKRTIKFNERNKKTKDKKVNSEKKEKEEEKV